MDSNRVRSLFNEMFIISALYHLTVTLSHSLALPYFQSGSSRYRKGSIVLN